MEADEFGEGLDRVGVGHDRLGAHHLARLEFDTPNPAVFDDDPLDRCTRPDLSSVSANDVGETGGEHLTAALGVVGPAAHEVLEVRGHGAGRYFVGGGRESSALDGQCHDRPR